MLLALLCGFWRLGGTVVSLLRLELAPLSRIVATFTFAVAFGSFVATGLGHFGALWPAPFLLVVAAAVLAASWLPSRKKRKAKASSRAAPSNMRPQFTSA